MPIQDTIVFPELASSNPGFDRFAPLVTVKNIKERYLHGIDLKDANGKQLKNSTIAFFIDSIISYLEHELEITITPTTYSEDHDYRFEEYQSWSFIQLKHKPVIEIKKLQLRVEKNTTFVNIPNEWLRLQNHTGQIQIAPTSGALSEFNLGNNTFLPRLMVFNADWPSFFNIEFIAGFEQDKIPFIINHLIGLLTAVEVLNIAGDLILGAGIAAGSISLDGLSQSVTSTASSGTPGYAGRVKSYLEAADKIVKTLTRTYGKRVKLAIC